MTRRRRPQIGWNVRRGRWSLPLLLLAAAAAMYAQWRPDIAGRGRAIDGDSLVLGDVEMRLRGIDAPEGRQTCNRDGRPWPCGEDARRHLTKLMSAGTLRCTDHGKDQHGRTLATCYANDHNINEAMVRAGFAVAYGRYEAAEAEARTAKRGLWSGTFERPRDWRNEHMR